MDNDIRARYRPASPHARRAPQPSQRPTPHQSRTTPKPPPLQSQLAGPPANRLSFEPPANLKTRSKPRKWRRLAFFLVLVGVLAGIGKLWIYPRYAQHNPFSAAIRNSVAIPLYYPQQLPVGYTVDPLSFRTTSTEVVFNANNGSSRLVFTQQKVPAGFDFNSFYAKQLHDSTSFNTPNGRVVIGKNDNRNLGSLATKKTWVLLSTNSAQPSVNDMTLVLKNLRQY